MFIIFKHITHVLHYIQSLMSRAREFLKTYIYYDTICPGKKNKDNSNKKKWRCLLISFFAFIMNVTLLHELYRDIYSK